MLKFSLTALQKQNHFEILQSMGHLDVFNRRNATVAIPKLSAPLQMRRPQ